MERVIVRFRIIFVAGILLALVALLLADVDRAYADCVALSNAEYRESADLIVLGTVENVEARPESSRVEVSVERVFKGESGETVYVMTDSGSLRATSVDVQFEEGARYLLYLREDGGEFTTSTCDGTREVNGDLAQIPAGLGEGSLTGDNTGTAETLPQTGGVSLTGLPLVVVSIAVIGLILRGRRST